MHNSETRMIGSTGRVLTAFIAIAIIGVIEGKTPKENWGYSNVRPGAHMFWWLYYSTGEKDYQQYPLIIWLQGGPGASSTGIGNFLEIGPLDVDLKPRNHTWAEKANLLFVDNPVGSGFSYVDNSTLLPINNSQIVDDFVNMLQDFYSRVPEFISVPMYIFGESYGGKMAVDISWKISQLMKELKLKCAFKGVALIDSWISPIDSVLTWGPFLYSTSLIDESGLQQINLAADKVQKAIKNGSFEEATTLWSDTETLISNLTNGISFYNIFEQDSPDENSAVDIKNEKLANVYRKFTCKLSSDKLSALMNGEIKNKLRIIPANISWGGQSGKLFESLAGDFMKPVVDSVSALLTDGHMTVSVLTGQLDLIVDTLGTLKWITNLKWIGIPYWLKSTRTPIMSSNSTKAFTKSFKTLSFYWVLKAGHMIPKDASDTALNIMQIITRQKN